MEASPTGLFAVVTLIPRHVPIPATGIDLIVGKEMGFLPVDYKNFGMLRQHDAKTSRRLRGANEEKIRL